MVHNPTILKTFDSETLAKTILAYSKAGLYKSKVLSLIGTYLVTMFVCLTNSILKTSFTLF